MPKLKTKRGAAKRFRKTGTGKIIRNKAYASHLLVNKSSTQKRRLRKSYVTDPTNIKAIKKMLPYL